MTVQPDLFADRIVAERFLDDRVTLYPGDCRAVIATLPDASIDSVVTDPPYALVSIVKRFGNSNPADVERNAVARKIAGQGTSPHARAACGFMGKRWDTGETAFTAEFWAEVFRVLKPGGHVVSFGGTRTYHRLVSAIEDAGFEIRDQLAWVYGSGFPKSHDVSKAIDKAAGAEREITGTEKVRDIRNGHGRALGDGINAANRDGPVYMQRELTAPATAAAREWQGWGTALKPAWEPICLARKPLIGTVAENVLAHGTGAISIDGCRVAGIKDVPASGTNSDSDKYGKGSSIRRGDEDGFNPLIGRWPANLVHDGSDEVLAAFPDSKASSGEFFRKETLGIESNVNIASRRDELAGIGFGDSGSAARFFYTAKADASDRIGSKHPTVKPVDLMQWLVRLVTPKGGVVLDPFAGTGTTGEAAWREGFSAVLIEREAEYCAEVRARMSLAREFARRNAVAKSKGKLQGAEGTPLFSQYDSVRDGIESYYAAIAAKKARGDTEGWA